MMLLLSLLLWQTLSDPTIPESLRHERPVFVQGSGQACAVLDAVIFSHAAPSLRDLRLFAAGREVPYAMTLSQTAQEDVDTAEVQNLHRVAGGVAFDLEMPERPYTDVRLDLGGRDYAVVAKVSGSNTAQGAGRELGTFTLFDMTTERLSRQTTISLSESEFRYLHIVLTGTGAMPSVLGAEIPPSRQAQTVYTMVAKSFALSKRGTESVAEFRIPARVPVERILVVTDQGYKESFSRHVRVTARSDAKGSATEKVEGEIARVARGERRLDAMSFPAALGANLQGDATVEVAVENGDQAILPIASISLEMRRRELCFDAFGGAPMLLYGGDLPGPTYGYAQSFVPSDHPLRARFGLERPNPQFRMPVDERPFWERNGEWLWMGLVLMIGVVGTLGIRYAQRGR
jgi:hypothetical protein